MIFGKTAEPCGCLLFSRCGSSDAPSYPLHHSSIFYRTSASLSRKQSEKTVFFPLHSMHACMHNAALFCLLKKTVPELVRNSLRKIQFRSDRICEFFPLNIRIRPDQSKERPNASIIYSMKLIVFFPILNVTFLVPPYSPRPWRTMVAVPALTLFEMD